MRERGWLRARSAGAGRRAALVLATAGALAYGAVAALAAPGDTTRVSEAEALHTSVNAAISHDGRYVAFDVHDPSGSPDVFRRDRQGGALELVSAGTNGEPANASGWAGISGDGQLVAFTSIASNVVHDDGNGNWDVFVRDMVAGSTERVSVDVGGGDADGASALQGMSPDGRYIAFYSLATDLVPGDTNGVFDLFLHDRQEGTTERISVSSDEQQGNSHSWSVLTSITENRGTVSADGNLVVFESVATNLDADGADAGFDPDVFVRDRAAGTTTRLSKPEGGGEAGSPSGEPAISADGETVVFESVASNLVGGDTNGTSDVFARDPGGGPIERVSVGSGGQADGASHDASISADGRRVTYSSASTNLVDADGEGLADVFVRDLVDGTTERVSVSTGGEAGDGDSVEAVLSGDGSAVAFESAATNLVDEDLNDHPDVYVHELAPPPPPPVEDCDNGADDDGDGLVDGDDPDCPAVVPSISIDDRSVREGGGSGSRRDMTEVRFTVSLSEPTRNEVSADFRTVSRSARAGSDFRPAAGTLTIPAGETSGRVSVTVLGDFTVEPTERALVELRSPANGTIRDGEGTLEIVNDDRRCRNGLERFLTQTLASLRGGNYRCQ